MLTLRDRLRVQRVGSESSALLARLHAESFCRPGDETWSSRSFADVLSMPGSFCYLAHRDSDHGLEPCGFSACRGTGAEGELLSIGVVPQYRRSGAARLLIDKSLSAFRNVGAQRVYLEVAEDNPPAQTLYKAIGFEEVGRRPGYYLRLDAKRVDALTMCFRVGRNPIRPAPIHA